ncbi:MAG: c-type cytochrome [Gemmatimonadales bacterium]
MKTRCCQPSRGRASREAVVGLLVVTYLIVSTVAYLDFPRHSSNTPLTDLERSGLGIWREHNCQACHQIYGFGGFLGPDLTNRVTDDTPDRQVSWILTSGSGKMPAFHLSPDEQRAVVAFLRGVNRTGRSQPRPLAPTRDANPIEQYRLLIERWKAQTGADLEARAIAGKEIWQAKACGICHVPLTVGMYHAPDLSTRATDRSPAALRKVLAQGRGNMPPFHLSDEEVQDLSAYLNWFSQHRSELVALNNDLVVHEKFAWSKLPWFEYK